MKTHELKAEINNGDVFRRRVKGFKISANGQAQGLCPFHDDHSASLSVNVVDGLFHCFACGQKGDVITFYQKLKGIDFETAVSELTGTSSDRFKSQKKVVATYWYHSSEETVQYLKRRIEPGKSGRTKEFVFVHTKNGKEQFGRGG